MVEGRVDGVPENVKIKLGEYGRELEKYWDDFLKIRRFTKWQKNGFTSLVAEKLKEMRL